LISYIKGKVAGQGREDRYGYLDIVTAGGVGYRVFVPNTLTVEAECELYTSFQVREDNQALYGFLTASDRDFFELLITVSGIGPKLGISILSVYPTETVASMILKGDHAGLGKVPGLGKKGSQRIVVELESKVGDMGYTAVKGEMPINDKVIKDLHNALKSLGFSGDNLKEYVRLGEKLLKENPSYMVEDLIKSVLKSND
jgi:Holliday junction DNA helicase RuvA